MTATMRQIRPWRGVICALALALCPPGAPAGDGDTQAAALARLQELERQLSEVRTVQTAFVQEKRLAIFDKTVVLEGRIALERGRRLAWHVAKPVRHAMILQGDRIQLWDEDTNQVQTIHLDANPAFKAMSEQMRAWFSGEYSALAGNYDVSISGENPLTVTFVPKAGTALAKTVVAVKVTFADDRRRLLEINMLEEGGDSNRIRFLDPVLNEPIPESAWKVPPTP